MPPCVTATGAGVTRGPCLRLAPYRPFLWHGCRWRATPDARTKLAHILGLVHPVARNVPPIPSIELESGERRASGS